MTFCTLSEFSLHSLLQSKALGPDFLLILSDSLPLSAGISLPCQCPSGHLGIGEKIYKYVLMIMHCNIVRGLNIHQCKLLVTSVPIKWIDD